MFHGLAKADPRPLRMPIGINSVIAIAMVMALTVAVWRPSALAQQSAQDLAVAAQNSIAAMYSLLFQNSGALSSSTTRCSASLLPRRYSVNPTNPFRFAESE